MTQAIGVGRRGDRTWVVCNAECHEILTQILTEIADRDVINKKQLIAACFIKDH
jgi:hypothetical protein